MYKHTLVYSLLHAYVPPIENKCLCEELIKGCPHIWSRELRTGRRIPQWRGAANSETTTERLNYKKSTLPLCDYVLYVKMTCP